MDDDVVVLSSSGATRHSCKVCGKGFACGRSLGGHMRSHSLMEVETAAAAAAAIVDKGERRWTQQGGARCTNGGVAAGGGGGGGGGYGLRENPKKTWRMSVSGGGDVDDGDGDLLSPPSFRQPVLGRVRSSHVVDADVNADNVGVGVDVDDDDGDDLERSETAAAAAVVMPAPRRRPRSVRVPATAAFDDEDGEPEDVARCLMMLSQDTREWNDHDYSSSSPNYYHHSDDYNFELSLSSSHHYAADTEINKQKSSSSKRRKKKTKTTGPSFAATDEKRGRYECPGCGRAFQSYQALGGHRASHKRINSNCSLVVNVAAPDQPEQSIETNATSFSSASTSASLNVTLPKPAKKSTKFVCPICQKEFGSGQALGGHKRSHTIAGEFYDRGHADREEGGSIVKQEHCLLTKRFLDLNLPAPGGDDG